MSDALKQSDQLLQWTIEGETERVANAIDRIHSDNTSILQYNDENSLACVLSLAYYAAKNKYAMVRELPTGKGFADLVLVPRRDVDMPAIVLELKYNHSAKTAISQIKNKHYTDSLLDYVGDVVLVGVNYDKRAKRHQCSIERITKVSPARDESVPSSEKSVPSLGKKVYQVQAKKCTKFGQESVPSSEESVPSSKEWDNIFSNKQEKVVLLLLDVLKQEPLSMKEIQKRLKIGNRTRFKQNILDPLIEKKIISPLYQQSNHPNQKYRLTDKAKQQLGQ